MVKMNKKILLVDDSETDRMILKNILGDEFHIVEAENGYAAVEMIPNMFKDLDAILLDVSMPVMDGFSVLQFMKESNIDNIPVFLITAEATHGNVEKAAYYNVCEFLKKPFEKEEILRRLRSRLGL